MPITLHRLCAPLLLTAALAGCGDSKMAKTVDVNGKVVLPPGIKLTANDTTTVTFIPDGDAKNQGGTGVINGAGSTFTAKLPPGKYKVTVQVQPYPGEKGSDQRIKDIDKLIGNYGPTKPGRGSEAAKESPLRHEVSNAETQSVTIDLVKGTISGN